MLLADRFCAFLDGPTWTIVALPLALFVEDGRPVVMACLEVVICRLCA